MLDGILLALQGFVVFFLLLHDWVSLGSLNNRAAKRREDNWVSLMFFTLLAAVPSAIGLFYSAQYVGRAYPHWLEMLLWITYGLFLVGFLRAWWVPYLLTPDAKRAARYQVIFAGTHRFLPERNGMAPDTLHTLLHVAVLGTLVVLFVRERMMAA